MTTKEAKDYLLSVRRARSEVRRYQELKRQAREIACSVTAPSDKMPGGGGGDVFARYVQYSAALDGKLADLFDQQATVTQTIARVPDARYRELLLGYYVQGLTWEQVAVEMNYSYSQVVQELHPKSLSAVAEIIL